MNCCQEHFSKLTTSKMSYKTGWVFAEVCLRLYEMYMWLGMCLPLFAIVCVRQAWIYNSNPSLIFCIFLSFFRLLSSCQSACSKTSFPGMIPNVSYTILINVYILYLDHFPFKGLFWKFFLLNMYYLLKMFKQGPFIELNLS